MPRLSPTGAQSSDLGQGSLLRGEKLRGKTGTAFHQQPGSTPTDGGRAPLGLLLQWRSGGVREERPCTGGSICFGDLLEV